jgi:hypothetical protein
MLDLAKLLSRPAGMGAMAGAGGAFEALQAKLGGAGLPTPRSSALYYICGVKNDAMFGGEDKDVVIYAPEFLYVFDLGYPAHCGVSCLWNTVELGDPAFPDFSNAGLRSIHDLDDNGLIYPAIAGELVIGVEPGTSQEDALAALRPHAIEVQHMSRDDYLAKVTPFHEREIAARIRKAVGFVRYAEQNGVVRLIDFSPGWRISRVL